MVLAVSSSSAALKVLQTEVSAQAVTERQDQDPLHRFLDPRAILALSSQSFDALLQLKTRIRGDQLQELQADQTQLSQSVSSTSSTGAPKRGGMLAWENGREAEAQSALDSWTERMAALKACSTNPSDSRLMPWNSRDVIEQLKDRDVHNKNAQARRRELSASDQAIYQSMAETPSEDVARMKAEGATIWYEYGHLRDSYSDEEFFRDIKNYQLYDVDLTSPIDLSSKVSQAFLNGTAQVIRGSKIPGFHNKSLDYSMYAFNSEADQYKWIGGWGRDENNFDQVADEIRKKNPNMNLSFIWADNDVAFILYPKTASVASPATAGSPGNVRGTATGRSA